MVLFTVFKQFDTRGGANATSMGYSEFLEEVRGKRIKQATIAEGQGGTEIVATTTDDRKVRTTATYLDRGLVGDLIANDVKFDVKAREEGSLLMTLLVSWGPMLLLIGVWIYFMRQMQGGGKGGAFSFGKSKARLLDEASNTVTFADVAGLRRGQGRGQGSRRLPEGPAEIPEAGRPHSSRPAAGRPSGYRQDAAGQVALPARPRCRSSPFQAPTSLKCSSAWAHPACATCSTTPRRTRPASSSSTKSTPSAASVARAWAAAMTSASRPSTRCWSRWTALKPTSA